MTGRLPSFLIIGLGNYTHPKTRHSVGQLLLESFAARLGISLREDRSSLSWIAEKELEVPPAPSIQKRRRPRNLPDDSPPPPEPEPLRVNVVLVKPKLLMNISGKAAALAYKAHASPRDPAHVIVLHDSLSHKPCSIHPRIGGSANGHNGVASLVSSLQGPNFHRIRLGIGRPPNQGRYEGYVLEKMSAEEVQWWGECGEGVEKAWGAVEDIVRKQMGGK